MDFGNESGSINVFTARTDSQNTIRIGAADGPGAYEDELALVRCSPFGLSLLALKNGVAVDDMYKPGIHHSSEFEIISSNLAGNNEVGRTVAKQTERDQVRAIKFLRLPLLSSAPAGMPASSSLPANPLESWSSVIKEISSLFIPQIRDCQQLLQVVSLSFAGVDSARAYSVSVTMEAADSNLADYQEFLRTAGVEMDLEEKRNICTDVMQGLKALHGAGLAHGDLKSENVLLFRYMSAGAVYQAKLADMEGSFSASLDTTGIHARHSVTRPFEAPEISRILDDASLRSSGVIHFNFDDWIRADYFSLGLLLLRVYMDNSDIFCNAELISEVDPVLVKDMKQLDHIDRTEQAHVDWRHITKLKNDQDRLKEYICNSFEHRYANNTEKIPQSWQDGLNMVLCLCRPDPSARSFQTPMHSFVNFEAPALEDMAKASPQSNFELPERVQTFDSTKLVVHSSEELVMFCAKHTTLMECMGADNREDYIRFLLAAADKILQAPIENAPVDPEMVRVLLLFLFGYFLCAPVERKLRPSPKTLLRYLEKAVAIESAGYAATCWVATLIAYPASKDLQVDLSGWALFLVRRNIASVLSHVSMLDAYPWINRAVDMEMFPDPDAGWEYCREQLRCRFLQDSVRSRSHRFLPAHEVPNFRRPDGGTNLGTAAATWAQQLVRQYLNTPGCDVNGQDANGNTALLLACASGNYTAVNLLLDKGADPSIRSRSGQFPLLFLGSFWGLSETTMRVLAHRLVVISPDGTSNVNMTSEGTPFFPLVYATYARNLVAVRVLRELGASPTAKITATGSAIIVAGEMHHAEILQFFVDCLGREEGPSLYPLLIARSRSVDHVTMMSRNCSKYLADFINSNIVLLRLGSKCQIPAADNDFLSGLIGLGFGAILGEILPTLVAEAPELLNCLSPHPQRELRNFSARRLVIEKLAPIQQALFANDVLAFQHLLKHGGDVGVIADEISGEGVSSLRILAASRFVTDKESCELARMVLDELQPSQLARDVSAALLDTVRSGKPQLARLLLSVETEYPKFQGHSPFSIDCVVGKDSTLVQWAVRYVSQSQEMLRAVLDRKPGYMGPVSTVLEVISGLISCPDVLDIPKNSKILTEDTLYNGCALLLDHFQAAEIERIDRLEHPMEGQPFFDVRNPLICACRLGNLEFVQCVFNNKARYSRLIDAWTGKVVRFGKWIVGPLDINDFRQEQMVDPAVARNSALRTPFERRYMATRRAEIHAILLANGFSPEKRVYESAHMPLQSILKDIIPSFDGALEIEKSTMVSVVLDPRERASSLGEGLDLLQAFDRLDAPVITRYMEEGLSMEQICLFEDTLQAIILDIGRLVTEDTGFGTPKHLSRQALSNLATQHFGDDAVVMDMVEATDSLCQFQTAIATERLKSYAGVLTGVSGRKRFVGALLGLLQANVANVMKSTHRWSSCCIWLDKMSRSQEMDSGERPSLTDVVTANRHRLDDVLPTGRPMAALTEAFLRLEGPTALQSLDAICEAASDGARVFLEGYREYAREQNEAYNGALPEAPNFDSDDSFVRYITHRLESEDPSLLMAQSSQTFLVALFHSCHFTTMLLNLPIPPEGEYVPKYQCRDEFLFEVWDMYDELAQLPTGSVAKQDRLLAMICRRHYFTRRPAHLERRHKIVETLLALVREVGKAGSGPLDIAMDQEPAIPAWVQWRGDEPNAERLQGMESLALQAAKLFRNRPGDAHTRLAYGLFVRVARLLEVGDGPEDEDMVRRADPLLAGSRGRGGVALLSKVGLEVSVGVLVGALLVLLLGISIRLYWR